MHRTNVAGGRLKAQIGKMEKITFGQQKASRRLSSGYWRKVESMKLVGGAI